MAQQRTRPVDGESGLLGRPGCRSPKLPSPIPRASILPRLFSCVLRGMYSCEQLEACTLSFRLYAIHCWVHPSHKIFPQLQSVNMYDSKIWHHSTDVTQAGSAAVVHRGSCGRW